MKSILFTQNLREPPDCAFGNGCRREYKYAINAGGRMYTLTVRDKIMPEDPYLMMVKATAFAYKSGEAWSGVSPDRSLKDRMIKNNAII